MRKNGFTLVEILVVMVVVGILIALVIPNALRAIGIANVRSCANNIRTLDSAIQLHFANDRTWPDSLDDLCPFLDAAACDPSGTLMTLTCPVDASTYGFFQDPNNPNGPNRSIDRNAHFTTFPDVHVP